MTIPNGSISELSDEQKLAALPDALDKAYRSSTLSFLCPLLPSFARSFQAHPFLLFSRSFFDAWAVICVVDGVLDGKIEIYETERIHLVKEGNVECELELNQPSLLVLSTSDLPS